MKYNLGNERPDAVCRERAGRGREGNESNGKVNVKEIRL